MRTPQFHREVASMAIDTAERDRRRALLKAHLAAENDHDVERVMQTFSADTEMTYNGQSFSDHESIRWAHGYFGWSSAPGAFSDLRVVVDREHSRTTKSWPSNGSSAST